MCRSRRRRPTIASIEWLAKSLNIPNLLTLLRLVLAVPAGLLMASSDSARSAWGVALFVVAGVTDLLDGWIARLSHQFTDLGKVLDPIADKVALSSLFAALTFSDRFGLPKWFLPVYIGKEFTQLLVGGVFFRSLGRPIQANLFGKCATGLLYAAAAFSYFGTILHIRAMGRAGATFLVVGLAVSLVAGTSYLRQMLVLVNHPGTRVEGDR